MSQTKIVGLVIAFVMISRGLMASDISRDNLYYPCKPPPVISCCEVTCAPECKPNSKPEVTPVIIDVSANEAFKETIYRANVSLEAARKFLGLPEPVCTTDSGSGNTSK